MTAGADKAISLRMRIPRGESRSAERLRFHYEVEKELANRLRGAAKADRSRLYQSVYDELFLRVPDHPQVTAPHRISHQDKVASQVRLIRPFLKAGTTFLEVGGGDCALSFAVAPQIAKAYGVEITDHLIPKPAPPNFEYVPSDGSSIAIPSNTVDLAFSFSVIEHVHPQDVIDHLSEVYRVLKPGGTYFCTTPNRLLGPHDISRYFDTVATGLHLKEYTVSELAKLLREAGFSRLSLEKSRKSYRAAVPVPLMQIVEAVVGSLPRTLRSRLGGSRHIFWAMEVAMLGKKGP